MQFLIKSFMISYTLIWLSKLQLKQDVHKKIVNLIQLYLFREVALELLLFQISGWGQWTPLENVRFRMFFLRLCILLLL